MSPEPLAKRTVEVTLGVYANAFRVGVLVRYEETSIPRTPEQLAVLFIIKKAVNGRTTMAQGKGLTAVRWVVGTGGPLTALMNALEHLSGSLRISARQELYPKNYRVIIDRHYNMAVLGVLGREYSAAALRLMKRSLGMEGKKWLNYTLT